MARSKGLLKQNIIKGFTINKTHYYQKKVKRGSKYVYYHFKGIFTGKQLRYIERITRDEFYKIKKRYNIN